MLRLRKEMDLYANLRPAVVFDALADASSLKRDLVAGLDILIVRELTGGVYFGEPRGIEDLGDGQFRGVNTQVYTSEEIRRVGRVAFELARQRSGAVCSVEKSNVMESGLLWRNEIESLHDAEFSDVALSHMYADNCAMQFGAGAEAVRCDRHRQSVRRHALGRGGDADRVPGHAPQRLAGRVGREWPSPRSL